jgi:predicted MPP superfamily phosphohydrolase
LGRTPDLVLGTGDFIDDDTGIDPAVESLARLEARLGRFYVLGSHDYYQSEFRVEGYSKYFTGRRPSPPKRAATDELNAGLRAKGWTSLNNDTAIVNSEHGPIRVTGVDDPYIHRDDTHHIDRSAGDVLAIGLVHAPDVVSEWMLHGFDLVVAGHTHGGQVRVPGIGALVSNCELPAALAGGLHRIGDGWLHASRGLGTGRFSPIRFACRPEVTVLDLIPPN